MLFLLKIWMRTAGLLFKRVARRLQWRLLVPAAALHTPTMDVRPLRPRLLFPRVKQEQLYISKVPEQDLVRSLRVSQDLPLPT